MLTGARTQFQDQVPGRGQDVIFVFTTVPIKPAFAVGAYLKLTRGACGSHYGAQQKSEAARAFLNIAQYAFAVPSHTDTCWPGQQGPV